MSVLPEFCPLARELAIARIRKLCENFVVIGLETLNNDALLQEAQECLRMKDAGYLRVNEPHLSDRGVLYRPIWAFPVLANRLLFLESSRWMFERYQSMKEDNCDSIPL